MFHKILCHENLELYGIQNTLQPYNKNDLAHEVPETFLRTLQPLVKPYRLTAGIGVAKLRSLHAATIQYPQITTMLRQL